jgi:uridine kinase
MPIPISVLARPHLKGTLRNAAGPSNSVITQYFASVKPMHYRYVEPHKAEADFRLPQ